MFPLLISHVSKYREDIRKIICQMIEFPVKHTSQRTKPYEDVNNVSINIYKYDPKYKAAPLRISEKQSREQVVDL